MTRDDREVALLAWGVYAVGGLIAWLFAGWVVVVGGLIGLPWTWRRSTRD